MFPMHVELVIHTPAQLNALAKLAEGFEAPAPRRTASEDAPALTEAKPTSNKPPAAAPAPAPATTEGETPTIARADVSGLAVKLAVKDRARALEILQEFGIKAVKEAADDMLPALHAKFAAALEG